MFKGKILKFSGSEAIILSDTLRYEKIKLKPQMELGQVIYYFEDDLIEDVTREPSIIERIKNSSWFNYGLAAIPALAILLAIVMTRTTPVNNNMPYGLVSIDINPSITLTIDAQKLVIDTQGENEDGQALLSTMTIINMPLENALEHVFIEAKDKGYLKEDGQVFIATTEEDNQHTINTLVDETLNEITVDDVYHVYVVEVEYDLIESAEVNNTTIGRTYIQTQTAQPLDQPISPEIIDQINDQSDTDIIERREPLSKNEPTHKIDNDLEKEDKQLDIQEKQEEKKEAQQAEQEEKKQEQEDKKIEQQAEQEEKKQEQEEKKEEKQNNQIDKSNSKDNKNNNNSKKK